MIKMNESYWQKTAQKKNYPSVDKDMNVDIVIVGGGLTGITLAYRLRKAMFNVVLLEKDEIGSETSGHTTAKITYLHDLIYTDLDEYYGNEYTRMYYESNKEALDEIKEIIDTENIQCDYKENESIIYTNNETNVEKMKKEKTILESFGVKVKENIIDNALYSIGIDKQAIFHPLKYLYTLTDICSKDDIQIFEHSKVTQVKKVDDYFMIDVNQHKIQCDYVVHASRYPFVYRGMYFLRIIQEREYVQYGISLNNDNRSILCVDHPAISQRPVEKGEIEIGKNEVKNPIQWYAQDSEALRIIPYIGKLKYPYDEYIAFGYNKWGMTLSHVASKLIADDIIGKENKYAKLYSMNHYSLSLMKKKFPILYKHVKKGMIDNRKGEEKKLEKKEGTVMMIDDKLTAVYKDENNECYYFSPYCPHLKCIIEFNKKTQTWDCPCHGSTYDAYGHLILGPSLHDLERKSEK